MNVYLDAKLVLKLNADNHGQPPPPHEYETFEGKIETDYLYTGWRKLKCSTILCARK